MGGGYNPLDLELDQLTLIELINRSRDAGIKDLPKKSKTHKYVVRGYKNSGLDNPTAFMKMVNDAPWKIHGSKNNLIELAGKLKPQIGQSAERIAAINTELESAMPYYLDARIKYAKTDFIPDANSTFRMTYGYVRRYKDDLNPHPDPFTWFREIKLKVLADSTYYRLHHSVMSLLDAMYYDKDGEKKEKKVPVCMLYNLDTTGGNSGSPVMDAEGNLVGINFDRAYTATLNDFAWNTDYSRSIGVDIRYVIFIMENINPAKRILNEMGAI
jgi:hypothetical protein